MPPSAVNSHPQRSDEDNEFVVVHNGIITNYKDLKKFLEKKGFQFESETDTEVIAKLIKHLHDTLPTLSFREIVEQAIQQLEGAFALVFKSSKFPNQVVATRRGSPLLVGIKTKQSLPSNHIPVIVGRKEYNQKLTAHQKALPIVPNANGANGTGSSPSDVGPEVVEIGEKPTSACDANKAPATAGTAAAHTLDSLVSSSSISPVEPTGADQNGAQADSTTGVDKSTSGALTKLKS